MLNLSRTQVIIYWATGKSLSVALVYSTARNHKGLRAVSIIYAHRYISDESLSCCCFLCLQVLFDAMANGNETEIGGDDAV